MLILRILLRVLCFPLVVLCTLIKWLAVVVMTCGSYVLSPLMLFIFGCGVYTVCRQQWDQALLLGILEACCIALLTGVAWVAGIADSVIMTLTGF